MEKSQKRALEDIDRKLMTLSSKRRRQDRASDADTTAQTLITLNPSIATSPPTLIGSPAPLIPAPSLHPSTPSYSSSITSSEASSESGNDASSSSSEDTGSIDYASASSTGSRRQHPHSPRPSLHPRVISPSTATSDTSTKSGTYTSASISDDVSDLSSSSSDASESNESVSSSSGSSSSSASEASSSSADSALSSFSSAHASQPPHLSVASLTAANLSHLQSRLNALLPKIRSANEVLQTERQEGRLDERNIENVGKEAQEGGYIEMDLGLGVLEEKTEGDVREHGDGEDESEGEKEGGERLGAGDVLGDLMGKKRSRGKGKEKVSIEEVGSG